MSLSESKGYCHAVFTVAASRLRSSRSTLKCEMSSMPMQFVSRPIQFDATTPHPPAWPIWEADCYQTHIGRSESRRQSVETSEPTSTPSPQINVESGDERVESSDRRRQNIKGLASYPVETTEEANNRNLISSLVAALADFHSDTAVNMRQCPVCGLENGDGDRTRLAYCSGQARCS